MAAASSRAAWARRRYIDDAAGDGSSSSSECESTDEGRHTHAARHRGQNDAANAAYDATIEDTDTDERDDDAANELISVRRLLRRVQGRVEESCVGVIVGAALDMLAGTSRTRALLLIAQWGMLDMLQSHEFIAALGPGRLKSKQLIRLAFRTAASPSAAVREIAGLMAADGVNINSSSAIAALHESMREYRSPEARAAMLAVLVEELDTYREVGRFLSRFFASRANEQSDDANEEITNMILRRPHIKDLAGEPAALIEELQEYEAVVKGALRTALAPESDEDDRGNLTGFVVYSGSEEEDDSEASDDGDSDQVDSTDDDASMLDDDSAGDDTSADDGVQHPSPAHRRHVRRAPKTAPVARAGQRRQRRDSIASVGSADLSKSVTRKRLRPA